MNPVLSPCVGLCSTTYGDLICRGCRRTCKEISQWHGLDNNEKKDIVNRLDEQIATVLKKSMTIDDQQLLLHKVRQFQINHDPGRSPWSWLLVLLVKRSDQIRNPIEFGFRLLRTDIQLTKLRRQSMHEMYQLTTG